MEHFSVFYAILRSHLSSSVWAARINTHSLCWSESHMEKNGLVYLSACSRQVKGTYKVNFSQKLAEKSWSGIELWSQLFENLNSHLYRKWKNHIFLCELLSERKAISFQRRYLKKIEPWYKKNPFSYFRFVILFWFCYLLHNIVMDMDHSVS